MSNKKEMIDSIRDAAIAGTTGLTRDVDARFRDIIELCDELQGVNAEYCPKCGQRQYYEHWDGDRICINDKCRAVLQRREYPPELEVSE